MVESGLDYFIFALFDIIAADKVVQNKSRLELWVYKCPATEKARPETTSLDSLLVMVAYSSMID